MNWRSFTEQYLESTGIFNETVLAILATVAKRERLRISERVLAGLERAKKGKTLGRPAVRSEHDKDAKQIKAMRAMRGTVTNRLQLGRSKSDVYRICQTL